MTDASDRVIQQLRELQQHYRENQHEAVCDGDDIGGAYFSGHVSALIRAQEVITDE